MKDSYNFPSSFQKAYNTYQVLGIPLNGLGADFGYLQARMGAHM